jgi:hypothetical protein
VRVTEGLGRRLDCALLTLKTLMVTIHATSFNIKFELLRMIVATDSFCFAVQHSPIVLRLRL